MAPRSGRGESPERTPRNCCEGPGHACATHEIISKAKKSDKECVMIDDATPRHECKNTAFTCGTRELVACMVCSAQEEAEEVIGTMRRGRRM